MRRHAKGLLGLGGLQLFDQVGFQFRSFALGELSAGRGEIKNVDRHLSFGIYESDLDVAVLVGEARGDSVQQAQLVLRDDLDQRAVG